jgi:uncharacterized protein (DUF1499 family)
MTTFLTILAIFVAANLGRIYYQNAQVPTLGVENGQLTPISQKPNNVSSQSTNPEKNVSVLTLKATTGETMAALKQAVESYGGGNIQTETETYLYVIFTTKLMKYHDDVEFWIDEESRQIHFRSASRAGYSDMGLNRDRYNKLAELYNAL